MSITFIFGISLHSSCTDSKYGFMSGKLNQNYAIQSLENNSIGIQFLYLPWPKMAFVHMSRQNEGRYYKLEDHWSCKRSPDILT